MLNIKVGDIRLGAEEKQAILDIVNTGMLSEGKKTKEFERLWAKYIGTKYCVAVNSGTSAVLAGLYALLYDTRFAKIKRGARVITSPVSYTATSNAVTVAWMKPVFVDINPQTFILDCNQIESLLKKEPDKYGVILPVHLMGYPNDMDSINFLARKYDVAVFEDSAQAHGSLYKGKKTGSLSLLADYSFYIAHNVQVGEMGAVVTNDERIKKLITQIKANGRVCACPICVRRENKCPYKLQPFEPRFTHEHIGLNFKTVEFLPAIAIPQVKKIETIKNARCSNVAFLNKKMARFSDRLQLPFYSEDISYFAYPIIIQDSKIDRQELMRSLELNGIETRPLFGCVPTQQPAYAHLKRKYKNKLPNADYVGANGFYVGCHQYLTKKDLEQIVEVFSSLLN